MSKELEIIKESLINICLNNNAKEFIPYLLSKKVETNMPNKMKFYRFFKHMLKCARENSIGKWTLRIEKTFWNNNQNSVAYNFYDNEHKFARLSIVVTEQDDKIFLETLPF